MVIRFSSLGDIILTTPVYRNLKELKPGCKVTVAVKEKYAGILEGNPNIDLLLKLAEGESVWRFIQRVRQERFTTVIDLHANLRSRLISFFSGAGQVLRYKKAAWIRRMFVSRRIQSPELDRHTVDRYLDALETLGRAKISAQNILVVQTAFLGDAVLTTPLFDAIKQSLPKSQITVLCTPQTKDIFEGNKQVDQVLVFDKRGAERSGRSLWKWSQRLKGRYDTAIIPHRSFRSAFLIWLARVPQRIGFSRSQGKFFLTHVVPFEWGTHDAERNMKLLSVIGISGVKPELSLPDDKNDPLLDDFLSAHKIPSRGNWIGMNPGSVWRTKRWLPERFAEVADKLIEETGSTLILFGGRADQEAVDKTYQNIKRKDKTVNLCAQTDLKTLTRMIKRCALFLTNDSGPMHIACAYKVPVVAIFGPTTKELGFFPYGDQSAVVQVDLECRPCALHGGNRCPLEHFECMKKITSDMVVSACRKYLKT